jgi:hypothetical protein
MTQSTVATKIHKTLDAHGNFAAKIALDDKFSHFVAQPLNVAIAQVFNFSRRIHARSSANQTRPSSANAIDGSKRNLGVLMVRDIHPSNAGHAVTPNS